MKNWKRTVGQKISRLTPEAAREILKDITDEDRRVGGATIFHPEIRELTGGFNSQSINNHVIRRLGIRAGIIKNPK